ncbi:MAG: hypothetical protein M3Q69_11000, partial [Acidobacteriota bacterium]|nr:hypothetical protein [Acidobacteriota bacterium]
MKLQLIRFAVCGALTLLGTSSAIAAQPISFDVAGATVHTHGLTPGGSVVLVGAWRAPSGSGSIVTQTCRDGRAGTAGNLD